MIKTIAHVEGMVCRMCEAHINDAVRKAFPKATHVSSSRSKKQVTFVTEAPIDKAALKEAIDRTGYSCYEIRTEPYEKKGFLSRLFG